jgi:hypothetical protein
LFFWKYSTIHEPGSCTLIVVLGAAPLGDMVTPPLQGVAAFGHIAPPVRHLSAPRALFSPCVHRVRGRGSRSGAMECERPACARSRLREASAARRFSNPQAAAPPEALLDGKGLRGLGTGPHQRARPASASAAAARSSGNGGARRRHARRRSRRCRAARRSRAAIRWCPAARQQPARTGNQPRAMGAPPRAQSSGAASGLAVQGDRLPSPQKTRAPSRKHTHLVPPHGF